MEAMTVAATGEMCRLVVSGPDREIEVAVPAHVLIADLQPALLHHMGDNLADTGLLHGGWALQRLGAPPFDDDSTIASLGLRDGDVIHLRPRADQIPPVAFDDLIDGVATGVQSRHGRWRPEMTRWASLAVLAVVLGTGLAALALPGPPVIRAATASMLAVGCLAAAFVVAHTIDRTFGVAFVIGATGFAGLAGLLVTDTSLINLTEVALAAPPLFAGSVAVLATAIVGLMLVGWARPFFTAVLVVCLTAVGGVALTTFVQLTAVQTAAVIVVMSTVAGTFVPLLAFRLAGLHLAPLPTAPEHLQEDLEPIPSEHVLARTAAADRYMTALYAGLAAPVGVALVLLGTAGGWAATTLVVLAALARMLAARPMTSGWHRLAMLVPALAGLVATTLHAAAVHPQLRLYVPIALVPLASAVLVAIARLMPGRRIMPYWGRIGDLVQTAAAVAMLPILLAVLDVYAYARAMGG
jgi:type VII secretion integral membrane protein EccD